MKITLLFFLGLLLAGRAPDPSSDSAQLLSLINQARVSSGLVPYAVSQTLTGAAQGHALDMAQHGVSLGHAGSDGSTPTQRIVRAGYPSYSWGSYVGENWAAYRTIQDSMNAWMSDQPHRSNILSSTYREIGVGIALSSDGVPILVTDFGAEPNVLPVFLNGPGDTVSLTLSNENAAPAGDGPKVIGHAVNVDIAEDPGFSKSIAFPYSASIQYKTNSGTEVSTLYVRFHDAAGREAVSIAGPGSVIVPLASESSTLALSPTPTATSTRRPQPAATRRLAKPTATQVPPTDTSVPPTQSPSTTPSATSTPTTIKQVVVRQGVATPSIATSAAPVEEPMISPTAVWLFSASAMVLLLAALVFVRTRLS